MLKRMHTDASMIGIQADGIIMARGAGAAFLLTQSWKVCIPAIYPSRHIEFPREFSLRIGASAS